MHTIFFSFSFIAVAICVLLAFLSFSRNYLWCFFFLRIVKWKNNNNSILKLLFVHALNCLYSSFDFLLNSKRFQFDLWWFVARYMLTAPHITIGSLHFSTLFYVPTLFLQNDENRNVLILCCSMHIVIVISVWKVLPTAFHEL